MNFKQETKQQTLILLLGVPGSGKSTFAKQLATQFNIPRISADTIRKNMFDNPREHMNETDDEKISNIMGYITHELLTAGQSVIYDGLAERYGRRQELHELGQQAQAKTVVIEVSIAEDVAMKRLAPPEITKEYINGYKQMVAEFMKLYEAPRGSETVISINGADSFQKQFKDFRADIQLS